MTRLLALWDSFRTGFWFFPGLMTLSAIALGLMMPVVDRWLSVADYWPWLATTPAAAGRTLSAFGGAIATASGIVFSTTIVVLSLASSQFGPRLLRTFLNDPVTQFTLGAFVGTSLYCLLVMRVIREVEGNPIAPDLSTAVGTLLSVLTLLQLIYFIHHIAVRIQAPAVLKSVAIDLNHAIDQMFPDQTQGAGETPVIKISEPAGGGRDIAASAAGYLQAVDFEKLHGLAVEHDLLFKILHRPGDFIADPQSLVRVHGNEPLEPSRDDSIRACFLLTNQRTPRQDLECAILELVEVAVRALSPGVNDPFTAMQALDLLSAALGRLARRRMPSPYHFDEEGRLRIIVRPQTFDSALNSAFDQIRQYGRQSVEVTIRGLEALAHIAGCTTNDGQRKVVRRQAEMYRRNTEHIPEANDRADIEERFEGVVARLAGRARESAGNG